MAKCVLKVRFKDGDEGYFIDDSGDSIQYTPYISEATVFGLLEGSFKAGYMEEEYSNLSSCYAVEI